MRFADDIVIINDSPEQLQAMLDISLQDRVSNEDIRRTTKLIDVTSSSVKIEMSRTYRKTGHREMTYKITAWRRRERAKEVLANLKRDGRMISRKLSEKTE